MRNRRTIVRVAGVAVVAWIAFEVVWSLAGEPAEWVDYGDRLARLTAGHQPEGRNGWPLLVEAGVTAETVHNALHAAWEQTDNDNTYHPDFGFLVAVAYDESKFGWELRAIDEMREAGVMDRLAEAARCPRFVRKLETGDESLLTVQLPNLGRLRALAKLRTATMRIAFHRGDHAEAIASLEESLATARAAGAQPLVIDRLVALAIQKMVLTHLSYCVGEHPPDAATARALIEVIDRQLVLGPMEMGWEAERAMQLDIVQRTFTDDGHGDGRVRIADALSFSQINLGASPATALNIAGRRETTDLINEWADGMIANARQTPQERIVGPAFDEQAFVSRLSFRHMLLSMLMSPMGQRIIGTQDEVLTLGAATKIMLGLEAHRAAHGAYPATLAELVPAVFDEVPTDPSGGGPFVYRYPGGHPSLPYMLFPAGVDDVDDAEAVIIDPVRPIDYEY